VIVTLDEFLNGNTTIGDASTDLLTINATTTFNASVSGLTKSTVGLGNVDNTSDINKPISSATQTSLNLKANQSSLDTTNSNVSALQDKTNKMTYDSSANALTLNEKIIITQDEFLQGSFTMGDSSSDTMTVNASTTFNSTVSGLTKSMVSLNNCDNTSDLAKPISTAQQTALNLKANDNATVHLSGAESISSIKTFTSNPIVPDISANDNSGKAVNSKYVDTANLVSSAPGTLDTLNELATALNNDPSFATTMATSLSSKGGLSSNNTWSGVNTFPSSTVLNGSNLNTRLTNDETNISTNATNISTLQGKTSALTYDSGTNTLNISSKVSISKDVSEMGNIYLGDNSGNDIIYIQGNLNANTQIITPVQLGYLGTLTSNVQSQINAKATDSLTCHLAGTETITGQKTFSGGISLTSNITSNGTTITPTELSYVDGATSNIQTQIDTKANDSAVLKLSGDQTVTGIKTFSSAPVLPSNSISNSMINNSCISSGYVDATSSIQTQINAKANDSAVVKLTTDQTIAGIKTFSNAPVLPSNAITNSMINNSCISSGYVDATSSIQTQINAKATDSLACHLAGTETISGAKTFSGGVTLSSNITSNSCTITPTELSYIDGATSNIQTQLDAKATDSLTCHLANAETLSGTKTFALANEQVNYVSSVTTALSLDYATCKGINLIATPTANYSLAITNVPTGSTNATYSVTLITTAKYYVNSITVNGTSRTIYAGGGTSNISVNASASYVMQQLSICFLNSSTPVVFSNVLSIW
jgi:hypothetical protein